MPSIHYYDVETGYIHYVSDIIPDLECRVYDAVSTLKDAMISRNNAVQFIPKTKGFDEKLANAIDDLLAEGVLVSNDGIGFMDRLMKGSPFRDETKWVEEGRGKFLAGREKRKQKWMLGKQL